MPAVQSLASDVLEAAPKDTSAIRHLASKTVSIARAAKNRASRSDGDKSPRNTSCHRVVERSENPSVIEETLCLRGEEKLSFLPPARADSCEAVDRLSTASVHNDNKRQCRICLLTTDTRANPIVSPCRCSGTMRFVHSGCLARWIDVSSTKISPRPKCELCGYHYRRRPFIRLSRFHLPHVDFRDQVLNFLFLCLIAIMFFCGWVAIRYLKISENRRRFYSSRAFRIANAFLTEDDITVISASILFFAAFFIALFTQYRAEVTVIRLLARLWTTNRNWQIRDYDEEGDSPRDRNALLTSDASSPA